MSERTVEEALRIIKNAENEVIKLETQKESALSNLAQNYNINSITEGDAWLTKTDIELTKLEKELEAKKKVLEEEFPWD